MPRAIFLFLICMAFCRPSLADDGPAVPTGVRVTFVGEMGGGVKTNSGHSADDSPSALVPTTSGDAAVTPAGSPVPVSASPGVRFGMELIPEEAANGSPMILEARLFRPGDPGASPVDRWMIAARAGYPAVSVWEFAYDWEVEPGVWTMKIYSADKELASAAFRVSPPPAASPVSQVPLPSASRPGQAVAIPSPPQTDSAHVSKRGSEADRPLTPPQKLPATSAPRNMPDKARAGVGQPDRRVYALIGGTYSQESRAQWMAAFLKGQGVTACVRSWNKDGRTMWAIVAGWRDSPEEARQARKELSPVVGDMLIWPMRAGELEKGLKCP
jgi:cell division septation protein DedD